MPTREERLASLLAQPECTVAELGTVPQGLLEDVTPESLETSAMSAISTQAAGAALKHARQQRELSMRQAGAVTGRSAPRIKAIEDTDLDIHLGTVVTHAQALGYSVKLTLTPLDGQGQAIEAALSLSKAESPAEAEASLQGETRIKLKAPARITR